MSGSVHGLHKTLSIVQGKSLAPSCGESKNTCPEKYVTSEVVEYSAYPGAILLRWCFTESGVP